MTRSRPATETHRPSSRPKGDGVQPNRKIVTPWAACVFLALGLGGCESFPSVGPLNLADIPDGLYEGGTWKIRVAVRVEKGRLTSIEVRRSRALQRYTDAMTPLISRILQEQSLDVDDVTGATMSSRHLKRAVSRALARTPAVTGPTRRAPLSPPSPSPEITTNGAVRLPGE